MDDLSTYSFNNKVKWENFIGRYLKLKKIMSKIAKIGVLKCFSIPTLQLIMSPFKFVLK